MILQELVLVDHGPDDITHVIGVRGIVRNQCVQFAIVVGEVQVGGLGELVDRGVLQVVLRQVGDQLPNVLQRIGFVGRQVVRVA